MEIAKGEERCAGSFATGGTVAHGDGDRRCAALERDLPAGAAATEDRGRRRRC